MAVSNNWLNLRSFLRKSYNREVNEWFRDISNEIPGNATARQQAKRACLILPNDSQNLASMKMECFRYVVQQSHKKPNIFGLPVGRAQAQRKYKPQVFFFFLQDSDQADPDKSPFDGQISFRLMDETSETITMAKLNSMANRVKSEFGGSTEFIWNKGKDLASYTDIPKGYAFRLLVRNKTDAKQIITKVLRVNTDSPNWNKLRYSEADSPTGAFPTSKGNLNILGKLIKEPIQRPICSVRFQYAYCNIWGKQEPVILYDRSFKYFDALAQ